MFVPGSLFITAVRLCFMCMFCGSRHMTMFFMYVSMGKINRQPYN